MRFFLFLRFQKQIPMLKPLLLLFFCIGGYWLTAQDLLLSATESLRNNVVRISVRFQDGNPQHGFGFITGEKNGMLYLATAAHLVHGETFDQQPSQIQIWFYSDLSVYTAIGVTFFEAYDLAILQLNKPSTLEYQQENWANFSPQNNQAVRFIGRDRDWLIPAQGEIYKFDNERINAYMPTVRPGTSGAPLVSENGIVGLIIEDDNSEVTAITLSKVRDLFTQGERFPYFSVDSPPISNPGVRPRINESDLSTYHMVKIEGGTFEMGCKLERDGACNTDEITLHQVSIGGFYLSKYEVTYEQFKAFVEATRYLTDAEEKGHSYAYNGITYEKKVGLNWRYGVKGHMRNIEEYQHPVIYVSHNDAQAYCKWLSQKTGKAYRLPTVEEWEYVARGGKRSKGYRYAGSNEVKEVAWYWDNSGETTHPVGSLKANELGLFDMSGNVWEWCAKQYCENVQNHDFELLVPGRGWGWVNSGSSFRLTDVYCYGSKGSGNDFGFRLARDF